MDKVILTKDQLRELKKYIQSRGFREPLIVMEILDHFACLVEEKLQANPQLTLDEAMKQAHSSFGVMGFKRLADAADAERNKKFNKTFKSQAKALLLHPLTWIGTALSGYLYYRLYSWVVVQGWSIGWPFDSAHIMVFLFMAMYLISTILTTPKYKERYVSAYSTISDNAYHWVVFIVAINFPAYRPGAAVWPFALAGTVATIAVVLYQLIQYRTWKEVQSLKNETERMFAEL